MKNHYIFTFLLFGILIGASECLISEETANEEIAFATVLLQETSIGKTEKKSGAIVDWARQHLSQTGTLTQGPDGFVYLKVDNNYINELFPMLTNPDYKKPPYFRRADSPGAHISVMIAPEQKKVGSIKELGQTYTFKIVRLAFLPRINHRFVVLQVESPELEQLRIDHGLSARLKGHEFHITIAEKKRAHKNPNIEE